MSSLIPAWRRGYAERNGELEKIVLTIGLITSGLVKSDDGLLFTRITDSQMDALGFTAFPRRTKDRINFLNGKIVSKKSYQSFLQLNESRKKNSKREIRRAERIKARREKKRTLTKNRRKKIESAVDFYKSTEWRQLRYGVIEKHNGECCACGRSRKKHGAVMHVDHIKPRSKYPELELDPENLQLLCSDCNLGKLADYETDWR